MDHSDWNPVQKIQYKFQRLLGQDELNKILENIIKCGIQQFEFKPQFKLDRDFQKFEQIYQQQVNQEQFNYPEDRDYTKDQEKFRKCKDVNTHTQHDVRQLVFPSYQFLNIFIKIYQDRLTQIQTEYHYKLVIKRNFLKVYYPKNQKISSFFKNQIFQLKTKLHLYYCYDESVIEKIRFSKYFNQLIEKKNIAAESYYRSKSQVTIFYSNVHERKQIIEIVNKNLLEHMTIISLFDKKLPIKVNQNIFGLIVSFLHQKIIELQKQNQIVIEENSDKSCILVHDRHECFADAKNSIQNAISNMIFFRFDGPSMRTYYNKVIRNHKNYPYLRVKYSRRAFFCVLDYQMLLTNSKHAYSFRQLFQHYFQNLRFQNVQQNGKITFYLKFLKYPNFIPYIQQLIDGKCITIANYQHHMNQKTDCSKIILNPKDLNEFTIEKTRKQFFEIFLSIIFKQRVQDISLKSKEFQTNNLVKVKPSKQQSSFESKDSIDSSKNILTETEISQLSNSNQEQPPLEKKDFLYQKNREKKTKEIQLQYPFKAPVYDPSLKTFWDLEKRQAKLQRTLQKAFPDPFQKRGFKIFKLTLNNQLQCPDIQEIQTDKIYLSTTIQKHNTLYHHLIDLNEFRKIQKVSKDKTFFIFFKLKNEETYFPSYALKPM